MTDDRRRPEPRRAAPRTAVFRKVKIAFGESSIDAVMHDISEMGAKICLPSAVPIPERVTLSYAAGGEKVPATRKWQRGDEVGFSFDNLTTLEEMPAELAWRAADMVQAINLHGPMQLLSHAEFFNDIALRALAEEAEAGLNRLEKALRARASALEEEERYQV